MKTSNRGMTLMELIISTFILSVGVLAAIGSFKYISTSIQFSKSRTLSSNLAQEQIEKLKNKSYYTLLVTTSVYTDSRVSPSLTYDTVNYPAQPIIEGGIHFIRATRVDYAYQSGSSISPAPYTSDDTALKQITVYVLWQDGADWKYQQVQNLFANPAAVPLTSSASGWVKTAANVAIPRALVQVVDNPNWYGFTDNSGNYSFSVSPGSYTLQVSTNGYYTATTNGYQNFTSGVATTLNFNLTAIASGTVSGYVYKTDHLVVSEVVASTDVAGGSEYIELYNPTTGSINIGSGGVEAVKLYIFDKNNATLPIGSMTSVPLVYVSTFVPSNKYYLIANTTTVHVSGLTRTVDAYYNGYSAPTHVIPQNEAGGLGVADLVPNKIDALSWSKNSSGHNCPTMPQEGSCVSLLGGIGSNEILYRMSDPGNVNGSFGRAYDTDDNNTNFSDVTPIPSAPNSTSQAAQAPLTGSPATGAYVSMNDLLTNSATCNTVTLNGLYQACAFSLVAATGTWTMNITTGTLYSQIQNVNVTVSVSTGAPNGSTTPSWSTVNNSSITLINTTTNYAFVSGHIYTGTGIPLPGIRVSDGNGRTINSASGGMYSLTSSTGNIDLTANPNDGTMNRAYNMQARITESFASGGQYDNRDFTLELGGIIRGYFVTSSNTPLPSRVALAQKTTGTDSGQGSSDSTGYFYMQNLSTGTYTVTPQLDSMETATPASVTILLSSTGTATTVSTFTVTSGMAEISGQVLIASSTQPITTGALIVASPSAIATTTPPTQLGSTGATCNPCYYSASSDASGNYTLQVRSSTTSYKVYGWYTTFSGNTPTTTKSAVQNVTVTTPGQIQTANFTW